MAVLPLNGAPCAPRLSRRRPGKRWETHTTDYHGKFYCNLLPIMSNTHLLPIKLTPRLVTVVHVTVVSSLKGILALPNKVSKISDIHICLLHQIRPSLSPSFAILFF